MGDFRTFHNAKREPARPLSPVVDPAAWMGADLGGIENWSYTLTHADCDEIRTAIDGCKKSGIALSDLECGHFHLETVADLMRDVREELRNGRGIVMLRGFPVDQLTREEAAIGFMGLGAHLGRTMPQNKFGHVLGHVTDLGGSYASPKTRGYMTKDEMRFHSDACDYVGLLSLRTSKSGGQSRVCSSVAIYNHILETRPELAKLLCENYYRSRSGEINPGEKGWIVQPVFWFHDGYFSAVGAGAAIDKAQDLPDVPKMSPAQKEALELYRQLAHEFSADIPFAVGDIQFLNNFVMLHTRRAYEDWPEVARKRHLLRVWLSDPESRPIPPEHRAGRSGQGVVLKGVERNAPLYLDREADAAQA